MKRIFNIIKVFIIVILFITLTNRVIASRPEDDSTVGKIVGTITQGSGYRIQDNTDMDTNIILGKSGAESSSDQIIGRIVGILQGVGSVVSVLALVVIGIRYMFSSLEEKAQMKGILIYYVIGATLVFAVANILGVLYRVISKI